MTLYESGSLISLQFAKYDSHLVNSIVIVYCLHFYVRTFIAAGVGAFLQARGAIEAV